MKTKVEPQYETHCSSPVLTSVTLLGLQHTAVVVRAGSNSREKYSLPTRCRSSMVTLEMAWSNHLCVCVCVCVCMCVF